MRYIVAIVASAIIVLRMVFPELLFDKTSLVLFGIVVISLLVKDFDGLAKRIKKIKLFGGEVELHKGLQQLAKSTDELSEEYYAKIKTDKKEPPVRISGPPTVLPNERDEEFSNANGGEKETITFEDETERDFYHFEEHNSTLDKTKKIEDILRKIYVLKTGTDGQVPVSFLKLVDELKEKGAIDMKLHNLLRTFWQVRNKLVHAKQEITREEETSFAESMHTIQRMLTIVLHKFRGSDLGIRLSILD